MRQAQLFLPLLNYCIFVTRVMLNGKYEWQQFGIAKPLHPIILLQKPKHQSALCRKDWQSLILICLDWMHFWICEQTLGTFKSGNEQNTESAVQKPLLQRINTTIVLQHRGTWRTMAVSIADYERKFSLKKDKKALASNKILSNTSAKLLPARPNSCFILS